MVRDWNNETIPPIGTTCEQQPTFIIMVNKVSMI